MSTEIVKKNGEQSVQPKNAISRFFAKRSVVEYCKFFLWVMGSQATDVGFKRLPYRTFVAIVGLHGPMKSLIAAIVNFSGMDTIDEAYMLPISSEVYIMYLSFSIYKVEIKELFDSFDAFWPIERYGERKFNYYTKIRNLVDLLAYYYVNTMFICLLFIVGVPFMISMLTDIRVSVFPGYDYCDLQSLTCYLIVSVIDLCYALANAFQAIVSFYCILIAPVSQIYIGLDMLIHGFKTMDIKEDSDEKRLVDEFKDFIKQHTRILKCISDTDQIFNKICLAVFWMSSVILVFTIFSVLLGKPQKPSELVIKISSICNVVPALLTIAFCGALIKYKIELLQEQFLDDKWWTKPVPAIHKNIVFMMQMNEEAPLMTIGGMYPLDVTMLVKIGQTTVSVFLFLRNFVMEK